MCNCHPTHQEALPDASSTAGSQYFRAAYTTLMLLLGSISYNNKEADSQRTRVPLVAPNAVITKQTVSSILKHIKVFKTAAA